MTTVPSSFEDQATAPSVSVVISTFNRRVLLPRVLEPLLGDPAVEEVIVVVDGSPDGSLELLEEMSRRAPRLRAVSIENRGMTEARMVGVREAAGDIVLLLDDDVVVAPGAVAGHARAHAATKGAVVVGTMPVAGGRQRDRHDYPRAMYASEYARHTERWRREPETVLATLWAGHISMARHDLLSLDPAPPHLGRGYHSDIDLGLRCRRAGLRGFYEPGLVAEHVYLRDPDQFVRDARNSGRSLALLHAAYPRELGPFSDLELLESLPAALRGLVRIGVRREQVVGLVAAGIGALGRLGLFSLQRRAAFLRWLIEQLRGAQDGLRGPGT